jgi:hypothetical protein
MLISNLKSVLETGSIVLQNPTHGKRPSRKE